MKPLDLQSTERLHSEQVAVSQCSLSLLLFCFPSILPPTWIISILRFSTGWTWGHVCSSRACSYEQKGGLSWLSMIC